MESPHLSRGRMLLSQRRPQLAAEELRLAVAEDPQAPEPHALLALALMAIERRQEATDEARAAIGLAPDWAYAHYVHGIVLHDRHLPAEALAAAREAIALDPEFSDAHALAAGVHLAESRFADALAAAEAALEFDPEHVEANNLRAIALTKLGRRAEAGATIEATLARDPEHADSHANRGWALLEAGDHAGAMPHFREALRLEPENAWARDGLLEALKARRWGYALMLRYFFWMSRLTQGERTAVILLGYFGNRGLTVFREGSPEYAPIVGTIQVLYFAFVFLTWTADPLTTFLLRLDPFGRHLLSADERLASGWVGAALTSAAILGLVALALGDGRLGLAAGGALLMLIPIAAVFQAPAGWPRRAMTWYALAMAGAGAVALVSMLLHEPGAEDLGGSVLVVAFTAFLLLAVGVTWFGTWVVTRRPAR